MENGSIFNFVICFHFQVICHIKVFDDYVTLHNLSMLLTYTVTLYHIIQWDVAIIA
jgi:hypothetical protein